MSPKTTVRAVEMMKKEITFVMAIYLFSPQLKFEIPNRSETREKAIYHLKIAIRNPVQSKKVDGTQPFVLCCTQFINFARFRY